MFTKLCFMFNRDRFHGAAHFNKAPPIAALVLHRFLFTRSLCHTRLALPHCRTITAIIFGMLLTGCAYMTQPAQCKGEFKPVNAKNTVGTTAHAQVNCSNGRQHG